jgi:putative endonuclease
MPIRKPARQRDKTKRKTPITGLAQRRGRRAEFFAALYLRLKGYRIMARNVRLPSGEIDLVARRGRLLIFVEVKYRAHIFIAKNAVSRRQWQRIERAAAQFVGARPRLHHMVWRFDVLAMAPYHLPRHGQNMWHAS